MKTTVHDVIQKLTAKVNTLENTVDTLKCGNPQMKVTGITVTFMPTYAAIEKTIELGANLLITHEGLFYSHWDAYELDEKQVYNEKRRLLHESGIAVYRFHDYWHRYKPDGIMQGLVEALEWNAYVEKHHSAATVLNLPETNLEEISRHVKQQLEIDFVRVTGDLAMPCTRIGLLAGYRGGSSLSIPLFEKENLDVIIYGEGPEWETPEYVKDSISQGRKRAIIILGHGESEEPGMKFLAERMVEMFPQLPVHYLLTVQNFQVM
ncbi:Putative GTP cyclohydrolase 1 type 2, NIF3 family [Evansella caseinilytica]|uniref:GTP cyclohydrolase 1 type 2 homolog n=1 Tax=Evansella caseinilytica TaxID=1503961 RepID=A0A1H3NTZ5_9BACI|nr:Nif3-like dinuclear metal center hexameric protein [Evansella caseinilytica]SDY92397.1 Putative GTP cyclohydrolase 1 type 2, NIF3 family [Evansella caseinilytica]